MKYLLGLIMLFTILGCDVQEPFKISKDKQDHMAAFCSDHEGVADFDYYYRLNDGKKVWFVYSVECVDGELIVNPYYPEHITQF